MKQEIENIDALISKFLAGEASPSEAMLLEDWKNENSTNENYFASCERIFFGATTTVQTEKRWNEIKPHLAQPPIRRMNFTPILRWAAIFVLILGVGGMLYFFNGTDAETKLTAQTNAEMHQLKDGSSVRLAKDASLSFASDYNTNNRRVKLNGSGYFTVEHDENKPFIVDVGPISVKDLGTKFDIREGKDTIFIRVDEGEVLIYNSKGLKINLTANEQAYYVISTGGFKITVEDDHYEKQGPIKLIFENQTLKTVVESLKNMYKVDIRLGNTSLENCRITSEFENESLELVLEVIAETLGLTLEKKAEFYQLNGKGC